MSLQEEKSDDFGGIFLQNIFDGEKISRGLRHFFIVDCDKAVVNPILRERIFVADATLRLRDFVFMVRKN